MLRLEALRVVTGDFDLALDIEVPKGARVALMGVSGAGKSTLLSAIAGFLLPDAGRVIIDGRDVSRLPVAERPLSILFQDGNLFPHLTVFENVALGIAPGLRLGEGDRSRVGRSLEKVGLAGMAGRRPAALSGGQRSRVALARMLLREQPLTLLDEPFSALDPGLRRDMLDLVGELCAETGQTLVMATHDLRDAARICDHLLLLEDGRVALDDPMGGIIEAAPDPLRPWL